MQQILPKTTGEGHSIIYKEYDVNVNVKRQNRGSERVVIGTTEEGGYFKAYYTDNHYTTYTQVE